MAETSPTRPKNVVILDAENPLVEIRGEFFWREDHDRLLAAAKDQAFCDGFAEGYATAQRGRPQRIVLRRRPHRGRLMARLLLVLLTMAMFLSLILTAVQAALSGR